MGAFRVAGSGLSRPAARSAVRRCWQYLLTVAVFSVALHDSEASEFRASWREEAAGLRAGMFPAPPEFTARYAFGWEELTAAEAKVDLRRRPGGEWQAEVKGGTTGMVRSLWKLDAEYSAKVAENNWISRSALLTEIYRSYRVSEEMDFRVGGVRSKRQSTKKGASPANWQNFYVAGLRDMVAAVLMARSHDLADGDKLSLAVFPGEWMYLVRVKVEGRETLRRQGEDRKVIRLGMQIDWIDKDYSLKPHKKFQRGTVWVSDDEVRLPLRVEVKVFVGSVFAELIELQVTSAEVRSRS